MGLVRSPTAFSAVLALRRPAGKLGLKTGGLAGRRTPASRPLVASSAPIDSGYFQVSGSRGAHRRLCVRPHPGCAGLGRDLRDTTGGVTDVCRPEHSGRSDRAAGWSCCPERTAGRRSGVARAVWVKPRVKDWRQTLCQDPNRRFGWSGPLATGDRWAERE